MARSTTIKSCGMRSQFAMTTELAWAPSNVKRQSSNAAEMQEMMPLIDDTIRIGFE